MKEAEEGKGQAVGGGRWLVGSAESNVCVSQDCRTVLRADFEHHVQEHHNNNSQILKG